ncbi:hypothetical protein GQ43DRAFT_164724 [Delitschia confertaspora ATCC 74209]|uniref:Uncharacterized protein n=1 Tax=Delitschia confertaspora ATCC 74209 TaxID=1513339 RepID=A0A9P4MPW7_9PLEO|nr:hypothetical protein GQ43DRAFT_164724 [Delitschia confertaspora ATCC 74209]
MKTFTLAAITTLLSIISALPTAIPTNNTTNQTTTTGDVLICTGANYASTCETLHVPFNKCVLLEEPFAKNVGSIKPASGQFCRITYTAPTCTNHGDAFIDPTPGVADLHHFNDPATGTVMDAGSQITSLLCQKCSSCV